MLIPCLRGWMPAMTGKPMTPRLWNRSCFATFFLLMLLSDLINDMGSFDRLIEVEKEKRRFPLKFSFCQKAFVFN
jgi:hypothetical protein